MTKQKTFKRQVRARMEKTTESYSSARRQLLAKTAGKADSPESKTDSVSAKRDSVPAAQSAIDTGVRRIEQSKDAVMAKTGRDWEQWFSLLDQWGAQERKHPQIARWLVQEHGVQGWWAQCITVVYEQARGMRAPGQHSDGSYSVSVSKTIGVDVDRLFAAFDEDSLRETWLPGQNLEVTTSRTPRSFRAKWSDDDTRIAVGFIPRGERKAQIAIEHAKLTTPEAAKQMKAFWTDRFAVLKTLLENENKETR